MKLLAAKTWEEVEKILTGLQKQSKAITKQIIEICWYMRGGITWDEAWRLSPEERKQIFELINENIKRTKESGLPLL